MLISKLLKENFNRYSYQSQILFKIADERR